MTSSEIIKILSIASERGLQFDFEGEKPASLIDAAERVLGLIFPPSYREFLLFLGCGDIEGNEFYGVISSDFLNSGVPDSVWLTLRERKESNFPSHLVIVGSQGDGAYYAIDCNRAREDKECPVIIWHINSPKDELNHKVNILAESFGEFFAEKINSLL